MGSVYERKDSPWLWLKWRDAAGKLHQVKTAFRRGDPAQRREAERAVELLERRVEAERREAGAEGVLTVQRFAATWLEGLRAREVVSAEQYAQRLRDFVFPALGGMALSEVRPRHLRELVAELRDRRRLAPRTVLHVYGTVRTMYREALGRELLAASPCVLRRHELPRKEDRDPTWRARAVFSRGEVEVLISDSRIPADRRALYALLFLTGQRIGEALARRWSDYDAVGEPLGKLHVTSSWSTRRRQLGATKTRRAREVPVHPVLAQVLAEWRLSGWAKLVGRRPRAEDLLFPDAEGGHRSAVRALAVFQERDLAAVGLRRRRLHDSRRTFVSLALGDGARKDLLRWVTHGPDGSVMDLYTTPPWPDLCAAVTALRIRRLDGEVVALPVAAGAAATVGYDAPNAALLRGVADGRGGTRTLSVGVGGTQNSPSSEGLASDGRLSSPSEPADRSRVATVLPSGLTEAPGPRACPGAQSEPDPSGYLRLAAREGITVEDA